MPYTPINGGSPQDVASAVIKAHHLDGKKLKLFPFDKTRKADSQAIEFINKMNPNELGCMILKISNQTVTSHKKVPTGRCKNEETVFKGTRQWDTVYVVRVHGKEIGCHAMKADAVAQAKQHSMEHFIAVDVYLEKRLVDSNPHLITVLAGSKMEDVTETIPDNNYMFFWK